MKVTRSPAVSYDDVLVESLRGDEQAQLEYLKASFEENGDMPAAILEAIRSVADARGFKKFSEDVNLNRENLYRVLAVDGNPRLDTFFKILNGLGLRLLVEAKSKVG